MDPIQFNQSVAAVQTFFAAVGSDIIYRRASVKVKPRPEADGSPPAAAQGLETGGSSCVFEEMVLVLQ